MNQPTDEQILDAIKSLGPCTFSDICRHLGVEAIVNSQYTPIGERLNRQLQDLRKRNHIRFHRRKWRTTGYTIVALKSWPIQNHHVKACVTAAEVIQFFRGLNSGMPGFEQFQKFNAKKGKHEPEPLIIFQNDKLLAIIERPHDYNYEELALTLST